MKTIVLNILTVVALGAAVTGCKNGAEEAKTGDAEVVKEVMVEASYKAIPEESMIMWTANKVVGGHSGTINVANGVAQTKGNELVGGNFIFDISTLENTDIEDAEEKAKLEGHLKSADFFDAETFPNATFEITNVDGNMVSGNLKMKGIEKNVTFPAQIGMNGDMMTIISDTFTIDRTEWDIKYNSGKFADPAKLGDYMIKDDVELKVSIKAKKA
ncbi:YceI family protein [Lacinutrix sp. Hel_I_90]|uniref:YceI family protein n=1 Tax=Lacinutrix sp. Hel_I_90 TaxID=1249999 RepID=UPI0005C88427|nr:YceI family protein [Lacinutrix sp. Hel_I_90]